MDSTLWPTAPRAAFPSYTFQVDSRGGIQAALPIQGVPVALSMMQTDKAFGSVTLSDAYTYGVPYDKLIQSVTKWAENPKNRLTLMQIRRGVSKGNTWFSVLDDLKKFFLYDKNERTVYLRVISRVYVVGSVNVAIINTQKGAADAQIGAARNIEMLNPALQAPTKPRDSSQPADLAWDPNKAATNFQKALEAVNANLGGAVKLQWATARSVALDETFPRPLVIGYLGFDFPIDNSGFLQCPIATHYQLESTGGSSRITMPMDTPTPERLRDRIERWLGQDPKANEPKLTNWLKAQSIQTPAETWRSSQDTRQEQLESAVRDLKIPE